MIDVRFVPVDRWPLKQTSSRQRSQFSASYPSTLNLLEVELGHLNAKDITIQAYFERRDIRNDSWPRSSARPKQPGVIVSFTKSTARWIDGKYKPKVEEVSFPCDRFDAWEDNLRAIALALEALRKIDRYGVTQSGEQYKGWTKLPTPSSTEMTGEEAALFIAGYSGISRDFVVGGKLQEAYRKAAAVLHPDAPQGSHELFLRLQRAKEILEGRPCT